MEDEINLNGIVYIPKSKSIDKSKIGIMEVCNVLMFQKIDDEYIDDKDKIINLQYPKLNFKYVCESTELKTDLLRERCYTINNTIFSYEFFNKAKMISNIISCESPNKKCSFLVYEGYDIINNKYIPNYPVLLIRGNFGFIIAPRVYNE